MKFLDECRIKYNKYLNNKAAASGPQINRPHPVPAPFAAAAVVNNNGNPPNGAEALISKNLTQKQRHQVTTEIQKLSRVMRISNPGALADEICHGLLDPQCFSKTANLFHKKLNAMLNSVRNGSWETPAPLVKKVEQGQQQPLAEINALKRELYHAESQINYCDEMIGHSARYPNIDSQKLATEKLGYQQQAKALQAQLLLLTGSEVPSP